MRVCILENAIFTCARIRLGSDRSAAERSSIFSDEVDAYCETVKERGAEIALEPTDEPYAMRDFVVRDPDGNVLTFGCPLPEGAGPAAK